MLKYELEERLGYQITEEGYQELNRMYNAGNLDKDQFASLIKGGAKVYKYEPKVRTITFSKYKEMTPNGAYYVQVKEADLIDIDVATGKVKVKNVRNYSWDGLSYNRPDFYEDQIIIY